MADKNGVPMITKAALNLNGITIAYVMGLVNAALACLLAFGVTMTDIQIGAVATLVNAALILCVHVGHRVGEATSSGASTAYSNAQTAVTAATLEQPTPEAPPAPAVLG